jgi:hypothetical protein
MKMLDRILHGEDMETERSPMGGDAEVLGRVLLHYSRRQEEEV